MSPWTPAARAARVDMLLSRAPVLPVLAIERLEDAVPLARTLVDAGLPVLEVTLRTAVAFDAISRIVTEVPDAVVGVGTVLDPAGLAAAEAAGVAFAISPGASDALYAAAESAAVPWIPAVATASEVMHGLDRGHRRFKFFPAASAGGTGALRAFAGPFPEAKFCPTGGIDARSAPDYLVLANVVTVGGSWMVPAALLQAGDWVAIGRLARACADLRRRAGMP